MAFDTHEVVLEKVREGMTSPLPQLFPRELSLGDPQPPARGNLVNLVAGVRRCGKTYRLYQEMQRLLNNGVSRQLLLYFNFDDERLAPHKTEALDDVITTYETLYPQAMSGCYLFLDEIQEVPAWGTFLRRMVDTRNATIYVTGSSSRMLSSEMPSEFRGRAITRELFPLSFREFCKHEAGNSQLGVVLPDTTEALSSNEKSLLRNLLNRYLIQGGFPALFGFSRPDAFQILQGYVGQTVAQDIIERQGLANARAAQLFASRCIASSAREISINKVCSQFQGMGLAISRNSLSLLLNYYQESYLVFKLEEYSRALANNSRSANKVYAVDPGLQAAFSPATAKDLGQRLETAVFDMLRRTCGTLRSNALTRALIMQDSVRHEIDFVVGDALLDEPPRLIQVCVDMRDEATRKREIAGLTAGMRHFDVGQGWIVTMNDQEDVVINDAGTIHIVPAWKFLFEI